MDYLKTAFLAALIWAGFALMCFRTISGEKKKHTSYLTKFEGRTMDDALSMARAEALVLPPGLVAEKVRIPFVRWVAFERDTFQFVLASDEQGKAHAFTI
jgi:hypothetical protein